MSDELRAAGLDKIYTYLRDWPDFGVWWEHTGGGCFVVFVQIDRHFVYAITNDRPSHDAPNAYLTYAYDTRKGGFLEDENPTLITQNEWMEERVAIAIIGHHNERDNRAAIHSYPL